MNRPLPLTCALLTAGLALGWAPGQARGQEFLGKPMAQWQTDLRPDKSPAQRRSAAFALGKIGKGARDALGDLAQRLADDDAGVREAAAFSLGEICTAANVWHTNSLAPLCQLLTSDKDALVRRSAAYALGCMRKGDDAAVKAALATAMKDADPAVRQNVAWALGRMGDDTAGSLRAFLKDPDTLVRRDAAKALNLLSPDAAYAAKPDLLACCADKDVEMRKAAVFTLVRLLNPEDADARPAMLAALKDQDIEIRQNAALALGAIGGRESAPAVPVLLDALRRGDLSLKRRAALAFKNLGPDAKEALPDLRKALHSPDQELRYNATVALIGFKATGEPAVPDLVQMVENKNEAVDVRKQAAVALSRIGFNQALQKAMPTLLRVVSDPAEAGVVRERTLWPVRVHLLHTQDRTPVFNALTSILKEPPAKEIKMLRYDSAYLLGMFLENRAPKEALDVLGDFLRDNEIKVYAGGKGTGSATGEGGGGKTGFKETGVGDGRVMAVDALSVIGAERVAQRPDLVQQLRLLNNDPNTAANLRESLKKFMPKLDKQLKQGRGRMA